MVPRTNQTREIEAIQLWAVRWETRHGIFHTDTREVMEAFTTQTEADEFANSLRAAFRPIRQTSAESGSVKVEVMK